MTSLGVVAFAARSSVGLALSCLSCEPTLVVGSWKCGSDNEPDAIVTEELALPWETSFEDGFCGYTDAGAASVGLEFQTARPKLVLKGLGEIEQIGTLELTSLLGAEWIF